MSSTGRKADNPIVALAWTLGAVIGFALMAVFVKLLSPAIPQFELVFFRSFITLSVVVTVMLIQGDSRAFLPEKKGILFLRGLSGFGSLSCLFYSIQHLPLSVAAMLSWSSPIFVILISRVLIGEVLHRGALIWISVAFFGVILILKPDFSHHGLVTSMPLIGVVIGLMGAAFSGSAMVAVRAATAQVGVSTIIFYFVATATVLSAPLAYRDFRVPEPRQWFYLLMMGLFGTTSQFMMTQGYRYAPAGIVSAMSLVGAAISALFGWVLFGEKLDPIQWAGLAVLGTGIGLLAWGSHMMTARNKVVAS